MERRIRKPSSLSVSLPDVSISTSHYQQQQSAKTLSPLSDAPILPSPNFVSSSTQYNIDDDLWAETADPNTGSVFFVTPKPKVTPSTRIGGVMAASSSSSSSLSSSTLSIADGRPVSPVSARLSGSVQVLKEYMESPASTRSYRHRQPSSSDIRMLAQSLQKDSKQKKLRKKRDSTTTSLSDLKERRSQQPLSVSSHSSIDLRIPQGAQFGSMGTNLRVNSSPFVGCKVKVEVDLSRLQQGASSDGEEVDGEVSCSLKTLGIVPSRVLDKGKFRSNLSLHLSAKSDKKSQHQQEQLLQLSPTRGSTHQSVVIKKLRAGSVAAGMSLHPGDTILAANGHFVNMENVDSVLATLSSCKTLELLIKKGHSHTPHSYSAAESSSSTALLSPPQTPSHGGLVRLVAAGRGAGGALRPRQFRRPHRHSHLLLYVTLDTKEGDPPDKDILFCYPPQEARQDGSMAGSEGGEVEGGVGGRRKELEEQLLKLRGAFLTLSDSLAIITEHKSCTNSAVVIDGQLFFLSFSQYHKEMLLLVLPAYLVSQYQLQLLLENIEQVIVLLHGSVHTAMTNPKSSLSLEHLIGLMLDAILSDEPTIPGPSNPLLGVPTIPRLKLPTSVTIKLHAILSGVESADHSSQTVMQQICRPYLMLGSCLLNRGALACSHLAPTYLQKVALFLYAYRLIDLTGTDNTSQIVIWQEVFLPPDSADYEEEGLEQLNGDGDGCRTFLLVVGLEQMLLCMLMRESLPPPPNQFLHMPSVDAVYIDRGRALLVQLKAQDLFMQDFEEISALPSIQTADSALSSMTTKLAGILKRSSSQRSSPFISKKKLSDSLGIRSLGVNRSFSVRSSHAKVGESDSDNDGSSAKGSASPQRSHSMLHQKRTFRKRKLSAGVIPPAVVSEAQRTQHNSNSLTAGLDDMLLHYVCLESGQGLMLCPTHTTPPGAVHSELLLCFQSTASRVREVLLGRASSGSYREVSEDEDDDDDDDDDNDVDDYDNDSDLDQSADSFRKSTKTVSPDSPFVPHKSTVVEHGILLECNATSSLKVRSFLQYWVIGRLFVEERRELYICCQESTSNNVIEMAFKLLFGWPE